MWKPARLASQNSLSINLAHAFPATKKLESPHGLKYVLDGRIETLGDRSAPVRTIWIVDRGLEIPRLVTAYPHKD